MSNVSALPYPSSRTLALLSSLLTVSGLQAASADDPGAISLEYATTAGPVSVIGDNKSNQYRVLVGRAQVFEQEYIESITIAAAFPDWKNPSTVILRLNPGGNSLPSTYRVLDVKHRKTTAEFCGGALRKGEKELVVACDDARQPTGWTYGAGGLSAIPRLTPEEHIRVGTAAYQARDYATALRHLWLVRDERFAEPPYLLGRMAELGNGVRRDYVVAMRHYQQAAERDYAPAFLRIGDLHANGRGVPKNPAEAMRWYRQAAELGEGLAQYNLGLGFLAGNGVQKDAGTALLWLLVASERLIDRKFVASAQKNARIAERELEQDAVKTIRQEADAWAPKTVTRWHDSSELREAIGKYNFHRFHGLTLLEIPDVEVRVRMMLGSNAIEQMTGMIASSPIKEHSGWLIAAACQAHECPDGNWTLAINLSDYSMFICLLPLNSENMIFGATGKKPIKIPRPSRTDCSAYSEQQAYLEVFSSAAEQDRSDQEP